MSDSDGSARRSGRRRQRGIFERPKGSGVWWVRYHDQFGREHREKVGVNLSQLNDLANRSARSPNFISERRSWLTC